MFAGERAGRQTGMALFAHTHARTHVRTHSLTHSLIYFAPAPASLRTSPAPEMGSGLCCSATSRNGTGFRSSGTGATM